jgi:hypothetical protein
MFFSLTFVLGPLAFLLHPYRQPLGVYINTDPGFMAQWARRSFIKGTACIDVCYAIYRLSQVKIERRISGGVTDMPKALRFIFQPIVFVNDIVAWKLEVGCLV